MDLATALDYLENDFSLMPMHYRSSCPADSILRLNRASNAKRWQDFKSRRATAAEVRFWYTQSSSLNMGAVLGPASGGLAVLDFKDFRVFDQWRSTVGELDKFLPQAKTLREYQVYFRYAGECQLRILARAKSHAITINLFGHDGNHLLPGSWLPTGGIYEWNHLDFKRIPQITDGQYRLLVNSAKKLNDATEVEAGNNGQRPSGRISQFHGF